MLRTRSPLCGAFAGLCSGLLVLSLLGCRDQEPAATSGANPAAVATAADDTPLAKVDDIVVTVSEFQERINRQSPYIRARYTSLEQKQEFLENLVRFEVLAKEAMRRGLDNDPEVVRTMKQMMIQKLMADEFETKIDPEAIGDDEMRAFYAEHESEYKKPEEVRVSAIILRSEADAKKVAQAAKGEQGKTNKGFRDLVAQHSIDEATKVRGGDLRYFAADTKELPAPVVEAAFALEQTGDVAGPIAAGNGSFYILKQTGRRKAMEKSFDEVKRQIQNRIYREKRTAAQQTFIDSLKDKAKIEIFEDNLAKVEIDTAGAPPAMSGHHGEMMLDEAAGHEAAAQ